MEFGQEMPKLSVATMRIVPVVEPDIPPTCPPGWPTKSMRYVMSKKLSTAQEAPGPGGVGPCTVNVVWPGLGRPKPDPAVMRNKSKSGSPGGNCPSIDCISVSKLC